MKSSLVILSIIALLASCDPALAQQSDFTKPCFINGTCNIYSDWSPPKRNWFSQLLGWLPTQTDDGCIIEYYGKYSIPVRNCPTSAPDDEDDRRYDNARN